MKYQVLMNDFRSDAVPDFLYAIVNTEFKIGSDGKPEASKHSFPYYLKNDQCPDQLFLVCEKSDENLGFDYYKLGSAHIISDTFLELVKALKMNTFISKKLTAVSTDNTILRTDLNYVYFIISENFVDEELSKLEEDRFGNTIPHILCLNDNAAKYDIFTIEKTLLSGYIFLSESAAAKISDNGSFAGIKIIEIENAFRTHCIDYNYSIELSRKPIKRKIP